MDNKRGKEVPFTTPVPLLFVGFFPTTNNYTREYSNLVTVIRKVQDLSWEGSNTSRIICYQHKRDIISNNLWENWEKPYPKATCPFSWLFGSLDGIVNLLEESYFSLFFFSYSSTVPRWLRNVSARYQTTRHTSRTRSKHSRWFSSHPQHLFHPDHSFLYHYYYHTQYDDVMKFKRSRQSTLSWRQKFDWQGFFVSLNLTNCKYHRSLIPFMQHFKQTAVSFLYFNN